MSDLKELKNMDLYELFEVPESANNKQIKKAYRKKALKLHPDKNPDNPKAAALFHQLSEALKLLTDLGARAAYDHVRKARKAAAARTDKLDGKRKKVKLDLEARERAAEADQRHEKARATRTLEQEIVRLREEGSRILEEEQLAMKRLLKEEAEENMRDLAEPARLKVKWRVMDVEKDIYTQEQLTKIFSKYGDVIGLIVSSKKKKGSAIVEFKSGREAESAHDSEIGFPENPLEVSWLTGKPIVNPTYAREFSKKLGLHKQAVPDVTPKKNLSQEAKQLDEDDFEALVFKRMREMQEKKRKEQAQGEET